MCLMDLLIIAHNKNNRFIFRILCNIEFTLVLEGVLSNVPS